MTVRTLYLMLVLAGAIAVAWSLCGSLDGVTIAAMIAVWTFGSLLAAPRIAKFLDLDQEEGQP